MSGIVNRSLACFSGSLSKSLSPGRCGCNFIYLSLKHSLGTDTHFHNECHMISLVVIQLCFKFWLGVARQHHITRTSIDQDLRPISYGSFLMSLGVHLCHDDVIKWEQVPRYLPCVFFDLRLHKQLSIQMWGWWFETPSRSFWRHPDVVASLPPAHTPCKVPPSYCFTYHICETTIIKKNSCNKLVKCMNDDNNNSKDTSFGIPIHLRYHSN